MALSEKLPNYEELSKRVFSEPRKGVLVIGGKEISKENRALFKEQAKYIQKSELWEIINASLTNEAIDIALIQSKDFGHVDFAKVLWHQSVFMRNVILKLAGD